MTDFIAPDFSECCTTGSQNIVHFGSFIECDVSFWMSSAKVDTINE